MTNSCYLGSVRGASKASRGAFTLVEMLIVIGIIIMLAGILIPVFHSVRNSGEARACASNMHQLGLGFQQYLQDYNRTYPNAANFQNWGEGSHWVAGPENSPIADITTPPYPPTGAKADVVDGAIYPYVKSDQVYICPSNSDGEAKGLSYSMNCAIAQLNGVRIRTPTDIVLLIDEDKANDGYFWAVNNADAGLGSTLSTDALTQLHNGGGNLLFCDGHVKFFLNAEFPLDTTAAGLEDKWRETGTPRFHDPAFGPFGSMMRVLLTTTQDTCSATARVPGT